MAEKDRRPAPTARRLPGGRWQAEVTLSVQSAAGEPDRRTVAVVRGQYNLESRALAVASLAFEAFHGLAIRPLPVYVVPFVHGGQVGILHRCGFSFGVAPGAGPPRWRLYWKGSRWLAFPVESDDESPDGFA